jgi:LacI family transcriptional regulator
LSSFLESQRKADIKETEKGEGGSIRLADIARESGVSIKTVSRAIHDHPDVNTATRARIIKIVEANQYSPNWAAQSLRSKKTHTIGFVVPNLTNGFFGQIGMTVDAFFRKHGYNTLICFTSNDHGIEVESLHSLINKNADGIIFAPVGYAGDYFNKVPPLAKKPLVIIDNTCRDIEANYVLHDNVHGAGLLVEHLIGHGHRRIACVTGPIDETSGVERLKGYKEALERCGLPPDETLVRITNWEINGGDEAVRDLFRNGTERATAVFFANSQLLLGGYKAFNALGLAIPADVAVVCFDPPYVIDSLVPRPTSLERFEEGIGLTAARFLFDLMQEKREPRKRTVRIRRNLSIGVSCGCMQGLHPSVPTLTEME